MKILIMGIAKTGTTALFYKFRNSMPRNTICLFEPQAYDQKIDQKIAGKSFIGKLVGRKRHVLAKILPFSVKKAVNYESFSHFDKQILLVRDPRDRLISGVLYRIWDSIIWDNDEKVNTFLDLLQKKEADPKSVSLKSILALVSTLNQDDFQNWINNFCERSIKTPLKFNDDHPGLFLFSYEDMVDKKFSKLESYVGIQLKGEAVVDAKFGRVVRTRKYGDWKHWFTPEDVEIFKPLVSPYLDRYYPAGDWELSDSPSIAPDHASGYVVRIVNEKRALNNLPPLQLQPSGSK